MLENKKVIQIVYVSDSSKIAMLFTSNVLFGVLLSLLFGLVTPQNTTTALQSIANATDEETKSTQMMSTYADASGDMIDNTKNVDQDEEKLMQEQLVIEMFLLKQRLVKAVYGK